MIMLWTIETAELKRRMRRVWQHARTVNELRAKVSHVHLEPNFEEETGHIAHRPHLHVFGR